MRRRTTAALHPNGNEPAEGQHPDPTEEKQLDALRDTESKNANQRAPLSGLYKATKFRGETRSSPYCGGMGTVGRGIDQWRWSLGFSLASHLILLRSTTKSFHGLLTDNKETKRLLLFTKSFLRKNKKKCKRMQCKKNWKRRNEGKVKC